MKTRTFYLRAFTLIELLTVMGIIAILASIVAVSVGAVQKRANETKEVSTGRQLIAAYLAYAADNDGNLLAGYGDFPAKDEQGKDLNVPENKRYPWRLAPYLHYDMRILWGANGDDNLRKLAGGDRDAYIYGVSVQPALGINGMFVGGDYDSLPPDKPKVQQLYGAFCVTKLGQSSHPASLIVFASAGSVYQGGKLTGYFKVEAPYVGGRRWSNTYKPSDKPDAFGFVDFRFRDRAVVAMLDGHVEVRTFAELDDMRLWAEPAAEANDPTWTLGKK